MADAVAHDARPEPVIVFVRRCRYSICRYRRLDGEPREGWLQEAMRYGRLTRKETEKVEVAG